MLQFRGQFTRLFILISILGFSASAGAKVYQLSDVEIGAISEIDDIDWGTTFPQVTPVATPDGEDPDGYQLDANDHLAAVVNEGMKLNIDGLVVGPMLGYSSLRFEMTPKSDAPSMAVTTSIRMQTAGNYDLRISSYDAAAYDLKLKITASTEEKTYSLKPNSRILFSASYLEAILFDGDGAPEAGAHPDHYIAIEEEYQTIFAGAGGVLMMEARPTPGSFTPQVPATPENPGGNNSNPNPSTNVPSGGSPNTGDTSNIPPGFTAGIGGGGGLLSCALSDVGGNLSALSYSLIGLVAIAGLRIRKRNR